MQANTVEAIPKSHKPESNKDSFHPLDFLTEDEIKITTDLIKTFFKNEPQLRFCRVALREPPKDYISSYETLKAANKKYLVDIQRESFSVVFDRSTQKTYEIVTALTPKGSERMVSCTHLPGVQPNLTGNEYEECENAVKGDTRVQEALAKKGITDISKVMVDLWVGFYEHPKNRIAKPLLFYREHENSNLYARPIDGIEVTVDLGSMKVLDVKHLFDAPLPPSDPVSEYLEDDYNKRMNRKDKLKPLIITQPDGVSFKVKGKKVSWQNWSFRVGFTQWEGLVIRQISYNDNGKIRPIIYRASIAEMFVPYGDNKFPNTIKNAFDAAEDGLGSNAHSLEYGCDCIGAVHYFDVVKADALGNPIIIKNAICLHEEDHGILWKHKEWRTDRTESRRSRRLVVSFFTSIANYDYGFYWYFYQDGHMQFEAKLTGILSMTSIKDGESVGGFGTVVSKNLYGPIHQHYFTARLDMDIDGNHNTVQEVNVVQAEPQYNPYRQSYHAVTSTFHTEKEAQRNSYPYSSRYWKVVNMSKKNRNGEYVGYRISSPFSCFTYSHPESLLMKRAGYIKHNLHVTPYHPLELHPAGDYPMQRLIEDGLSKWTQADRNIFQSDIVVWLTFGLTHVTRTEDAPIMPSESISFSLKPDNFFDYNPSMDVPPSHNSNHHSNNGNNQSCPPKPLNLSSKTGPSGSTSISPSSSTTTTTSSVQSTPSTSTNVIPVPVQLLPQSKL